LGGVGRSCEWRRINGRTCGGLESRGNNAEHDSKQFLFVPLTSELRFLARSC
jgi:hypothetical protein